MAEDDVSNSSGGRLPLSGIRETGRVLSANAFYLHSDVHNNKSSSYDDVRRDDTSSGGELSDTGSDSYSASNGESYPYYRDNNNDNHLDRDYSYNGYYYDHHEMRHNDSRNENGDYYEDGDCYYEEENEAYSDEYSVDSDDYSDYSDDYSEGYTDDGYSSGGYWSE